MKILLLKYSYSINKARSIKESERLINLEKNPCGFSNISVND